MFIIRAPQYLAAVDFTLHYRRDGAGWAFPARSCPCCTSPGLGSTYCAAEARQPAVLHRFPPFRIVEPTLK